LAIRLFEWADITFAPIATRFQTHGAQLAGAAKTYMTDFAINPRL